MTRWKERDTGGAIRSTMFGMWCVCVKKLTWRGRAQNVVIELSVSAKKKLLYKPEFHEERVRMSAIIYLSLQRRNMFGYTQRKCHVFIFLLSVNTFLANNLNLKKKVCVLFLREFELSMNMNKEKQHKKKPVVCTCLQIFWCLSCIMKQNLP